MCKITNNVYFYTHPPTHSPTGKWNRSALYFCDGQCRNILEGTFVFNKASVLECENVCSQKRGCTAFNFRETPPNCQLRNCPQPAPAPTGEDPGIPGFSHRSSGYFFTTQDNAFTDDQCPNIGSRSDATLSECKDICKKEEGCTAFNFASSPSANCILRRCPEPVSPPTCTDYPEFGGHFHYKVGGKNLCKISNQMNFGK